MQGFQLGVDYWSIEEEDIVDVLPSSIVLQSVEARPELALRLLRPPRRAVCR